MEGCVEDGRKVAGYHEDCTLHDACNSVILNLTERRISDVHQRSVEKEEVEGMRRNGAARGRKSLCRDSHLHIFEAVLLADASQDVLFATFLHFAS